MWIQESVDISQFSGKVVHLRFEQITDAGVNGEGFVLDDIEIPEIGYFADFEEDEGGWSPEGFVRIQNILPQTFRVVLLSFGKEIGVNYLLLSSNNQLYLPFEIGNELRSLVLIVAGTTPFTRQKAEYHISIETAP